MKNECKEFLQDYISKSCYGDGSEYDFYALFKQFSEFEIKCKEDIKPAIDEFFAFLVACDQIILKSGIKNPPKLVRYSSRALHSVFSKPMTAGQRAFAETVKQIAPNGVKTSILDVGAGMYPKTAIYLAETIESVSALDKLFILSNASMRALNVTAYQQTFDANTQIKEFDFIVGRYPCSAIEDIVKSCVKQDKPYFIELCECSLPKSPQGKRISEWESILKGYDPFLKFVPEGFVSNIDANKVQMQQAWKKIKLESTKTHQSKNISSAFAKEFENMLFL